MSDDKTEKATPKRRKESRDKGQVVKSVEVSAAVTLLVSFFVIKIFSTTIMNDLRLLFTDFLSGTYFARSENLNVNFQSIYMVVLKHLFTVCGPFLLAAFIIGLFINYIQVGFLFLPNQIAMKFDKINPLSGIKRLFSLRTFVQFIKAVLNMLVVGVIVYSEFMNSFKKIPNLILEDTYNAATFVFGVMMNIMWKAGLAIFILGAFDYGYQWWQHEKELKMSKEEIKQEYKLMEGDPKIKSRIRQVQREMGMRRMMQEIPKADVVITNPTHFAIAVKYDQKIGKAPIVIAKGQDIIALKIKEEARLHNIHITENKPLAQLLFKSTEIGQEIPEELFKAVAEILAFVYQMRDGK